MRSLLTTCELFESAMKAMYNFASKRPSFPDYVEKLEGDTLFDRLCRITGTVKILAHFPATT